MFFIRRRWDEQTWLEWFMLLEKFFLFKCGFDGRSDAESGE